MVWFLAKAVVNPPQGSFVVRVCNTLEEVVVLHQGMSVGVLSPAELSESSGYGEGSHGSCQRLAKVSEGQGLPEHLTDLYDRAVENVPEEDRAQIRELLVKYQDVFSRDDKDLGRTSLVKHHIETGDTKPIKQAPVGYPLIREKRLKNRFWIF